MPDMSAVRRFQFLITAGAQADLAACKAEDRWAAAKIATLLREVTEDIVAAEALVDERYNDREIDSISGVWSLQDKRINAYRVRMVLVSRWRIITAVDHPSRRVAVMAIMPRDEDYEKSRELWERIEREYDALGFTRYGRG